MASDDTLVLIATYDYDWQAHIAAGVLDEHGIPSTIDNEIFASLYPIGFNQLGGVNLRVFARDAVRAADLLRTARIS